MKKSSYVIWIFFLVGFSNPICRAALASPELSQEPNNPSQNIVVDSVSAVRNDSVRVTELDELVVKSDSRWFEDDKLVCVPTKQERNISNSPETLIEAMSIPMLKVKDGKVSDIRGYEVVYYINGVKAEVSDISTFWPKDALRVEYLRNPTDPKYEGAPAVVNFVMKEYEVGGITSLKGTLYFPLSSYYNVSSKLVYKRMTYGVMCRGGFSDDVPFVSENSEEYRDLFYNGKYFDSILRDFSKESRSESHSVNAAVNARYKDSALEMVHTLAMKYDRSPLNSQINSDSWTPDIFGSSRSTSGNDYKNITPGVSGYYGGFVMPEKLYISGGWEYSFSRNRDFSVSRIGDLTPLTVNAHENVHHMQLVLQPSLTLSPKWFMSLRIQGNGDWFKTVYSGSTDVVSDQKRLQLNTILNASWSPTTKIRLSLSPTFLLSRFESGGIVSKTAYPSASMNFGWSVSDKLSLGSNAIFQFSQPPASATADVLLRSSEMLWIKGNPNLENLYFTMGYIYATYMPLSWLYGTLSASYQRMDNFMINVYEPAPSDLGGLVKTTVNAPVENKFSVNMDISASFFNNALRINFNPSFSHDRVAREYPACLNWFYFETAVTYNVRNFSFFVQYNSKRKSIADGGMGRLDMPYDMIVNASYGNGDFRVCLSATNVFRKNSRSHHVIDSRYYRCDLNNVFVGRFFGIDLSYTFGYGKKVSPNMKFDTPGSTSGIIK